MTDGDTWLESRTDVNWTSLILNLKAFSPHERIIDMQYPKTDDVLILKQLRHKHKHWSRTPHAEMLLISIEYLQIGHTEYSWQRIISYMNATSGDPPPTINISSITILPNMHHFHFCDQWNKGIGWKLMMLNRMIKMNSGPIFELSLFLKRHKFDSYINMTWASESYAKIYTDFW